MNLPADIVTDVLKTVKRKGATAAEVAYSQGGGVTVSCRGETVDTVEYNEDKSLVVTVYNKQSSGSASTAVIDKDSVALTIDKAWSIAQLTEPDTYAGLADVAELATEFRDLKTYYNNTSDTACLIRQATSASLSAIDYANTNGHQLVVDESNVEVGTAYSMYANSVGFIGEKKSSNVSASVVAIAQNKHGMERSYWWDAVRDFNQLEKPEILGIKAAKETLSRMGARKLKSCRAPVLFDPSMSKTLLSHFIQSISGGALYQEASFLKDDLNRKLFPDWFGLHENPFVESGFASRNYDANGVMTRERMLVDNGTLNGFLLSVYSARRLGMKTTGNAGGVHNLFVKTTTSFVDEPIKQLNKGLLVTSLMGQGFNAVTGDYSRGASGFWVENGEIQYPVSELTIAGNLRNMFENLCAVGSDIDRRSHIQTGSWLIDEMSIAGN